jgi:hypothetical protein
MIEVAITREQTESMLHDERSRPEVVGRDRGALRAELAKQARVLMRRLVVPACSFLLNICWP